MNRARTARSVALSVLVGLVVLPVTSAGREVPFLTGRVNDLADMLSPQAETEIASSLEALETSTGAQVVVLTIPSLEGEILEDYSLRVAETWKLGRGQFDDGALLLIARDERQTRLEVGYGLEGAIPDALSKRILDDILRPRFRSGDFDGGVAAAVDAIAALVSGDDTLPAPTSGAVAPGSDTIGVGIIAFLLFLIPVGLFSLQALSARGCVAWFLYIFLMPFWLVFPLILLGRPMGFAPFVLWLVGFPVLWALIHRTAGGRRLREAGWGPLAGSGRGWSSSGGGWGGGSGGGGFSGGGGSFGGGGASGSW